MSATDALRRHAAVTLVIKLSCFCGITLIAVSTVRAQIDPDPRQLLHLGVNQSLHDDGPQAHYLFYYWNMPASHSPTFASDRAFEDLRGARVPIR